MRGVCTLLVLLCLGGVARASSFIPFVGCETEGMFPTPAPIDGAPMRVDWPRRVAKQLAVYRLAVYPDTPPFIIAPRGWHCEGIASSSDVAIWVYPGTDEDKTGPLIMFDQTDGYSENLDSIDFAIRYFPKLLSFSDFYKATQNTPADVPESQLIEPPHPHDIVQIIGVTTLQYRTPGGTSGLGDHDYWLEFDTSTLETDGFLKLYFHPHMPTPDGDYDWYAVRLPPADVDLKPYLMRYMKACLLKVNDMSCPQHANSDYGIK